MKEIAFLDSEIDPKSKNILDLGCYRENGSLFHSNNLAQFREFIKGANFICGHNIFNHDLKYLKHEIADAGIEASNSIDTLYLSPLLFPRKPYHALLKDDKLQTEELNNPLNDSLKAKELFYDLLAAFARADELCRDIFFLLLFDKREFRGFFNYLSYATKFTNVGELIREKFGDDICHQASLDLYISEHPIELAYCLALINTQSLYSITPPWVLHNFPATERLMFQLRGKPCLTGCAYCDKALDIHLALKRFFGFDAYRTYGGEPLQENAVEAAVANKSLLAVFPTGGGKSITFQIPALMSGESTKGLTVVISPLQSLMKDQVDNLERNGITSAVTINGLLDPIERSKSFERVEDGSAYLLYISPESLRSKSIQRLLLGRKIARFVIDEAHCFSSWGQDFRVDYLYIGDFIKSLQEKKCLLDPIPVSCFTATAKQKVIEDIRLYFKEKLNHDLELFTSKVSRTNLQYRVFERDDEEDKYNTLRDLIEEKDCPSIVYVSRTNRAYKLAERLKKDGFNARPYHGKMDAKDKAANQNGFISGEIQIMVATSAFGMGVDKKDVRLVVHYEISDSLENYIQEAGRAGRDESIEADCFVLFNEEDLSKHFILLNQTKLSINEIKQVWNAIKFISKHGRPVSNSALEIARKAGWDDNISEIETRVTTAIAALEDAGYLERGQNSPRIFANSILSKTAQEAIDKITTSPKFDEKQKQKAIRIIKKLFSSKSKKHSNDEVAESRVDYISDHLGMVKEEVIKIITLLRDEKILADAKDLTAFIKRGESRTRSVSCVQAFSQLERFLFKCFEEESKLFNIKDLNERAFEDGCNEVSPNKIKTLINFWALKHWIKSRNHYDSKSHVEVVCIQPKEELKEKLKRRHELSKFIVDYLYKKSVQNADDSGKEEVLVEFSVHELKLSYETGLQLFNTKISIEDVEDSLFYLSRIEAIKIEGGFLVVYNRLTINRVEQNNQIQYKKDDYEKLNQFYENKVQQIHIVGEYAKKMVEDDASALRFVEDYFHLNYTSFLNKYFPGSRQNEIKRNLTPGKYKQLFSELSPVQLDIINNKQARYIVVAAGPGSGKTKVLVHKLASLLLMEDVKHEQLLMLTFSRAAATEFKKRLIKLIGNAAHFIEIKTFHSFCFDLLGKVGNLEKSDAILKNTIEKISNGEVEANKITRTVLVIDEAQDMDEDEFALVSSLIERNEDLRVIAVGDDDQNIYAFRGSDSKYLEQLIKRDNAVKYELVENYRSKNNLVQFSNQFVKKIHNRLKVSPIVAKQPENGNIKLVQYTSNNLISPLVEEVASASLAGTTCILTKTNEEALQVTGLLIKKGVPAKLIQSNEGFNLTNLLEIRFFLDVLQVREESYIIDEEVWKYAKKEMSDRFRNSSKLELCSNLIRDFESSYPGRKYRSDLQTFLWESCLEDFYSVNSETILVSTIHKAKGKEFDNVFLLLDNFNSSSDEAKRQLYVAITRAKQNLSIHTNGTHFSEVATDNLVRVLNPLDYSPPGELVMQLSFKDVWLGYFKGRQGLLNELFSGDILSVSEDGCFNSMGDCVLKFSRSFQSRLEFFCEKGFRLKSAKVNFIIYWKGVDMLEEVKILLPEICLVSSVQQ